MCILKIPSSSSPPRIVRRRTSSIAPGQRSSVQPHQLSTQQRAETGIQRSGATTQCIQSEDGWIELWPVKATIGSSPDAGEARQRRRGITPRIDESRRERAEQDWGGEALCLLRRSPYRVHPGRWLRIQRPSPGQGVDGK